MERLTNQPSATPAETQVETPPTETLEDIAKGLSVEEQANQFVSTVQPQYQPQHQPQPQSYQPSQFNAPDPVTDPEGYRAFVAQQYNTVNTLNSTIQEVTNKIGNWERTQAEQKINQDVDRAVTLVNQKANLDKDIVEVALELEYRKNPSFKKIWDNRDRNPDALGRALEVLSGKISQRFAVRTDPQLAENLRAAKSSQQTQATTRQPQMNDGIPNDPAEFERFWQSLSGRGM